MKMIDVLNMMAEGEIKEGTKLEIGNKIYTYTDEIARRECSFIDIEDDEIELLEDAEIITEKFLNFDVELIPPKPKKYLVKFNMRGLKESEMYLNYQTENDYVFIDTTKQSVVHKTHFTKSELKSIKLVREFLEDMEGKYTLIEVEE